MPRQYFASLAHAEKKSLLTEKDKGIGVQSRLEMLPCKGPKSKGPWKAQGQTSLPTR